MKRIKDLYEKIYSIENLKQAHRNARKDKAFYKEVRDVDKNLDNRIQQIHELLKSRSYEVSNYSCSVLRDKGKVRELMKLPYFPDRIVQWAIMLQLEDVFMKTFCTHSCASVKGRGIHRASSLVRRYLRNEDEAKYCLKMDIRKFYPNIDHHTLKDLLRRKIKDPDVLEILDRIIGSVGSGVGVPIGSYLSQYLANFYLTYFDHWVKEDLKLKYVVRYMDDIVIFHHSKEYLHEVRKQIESYLAENLKLTLKENWQVFPVQDRGVDFVGYRHFFGYCLLRKRTCKRFKHRMKLIRRKINRGCSLTQSDYCAINSYAGWLKWCDSYRLREKYIGPVQNKVDEYYQKSIKKG